MKVLMFGWEYPPHVFGGLATADIETVLCLPHPFGDESQHACRIVAMNAVPIAWRDVDYDYVKQRVGNIMDPDYYFKLRDHIYADIPAICTRRSITTRSLPVRWPVPRSSISSTPMTG